LPSDFNVFWGVIFGVVTLINIISGLFIAWSNRSKQRVKEVEEKTEQNIRRETEIGLSISHINSKLDDIKVDMKVQNNSLNEKLEKYIQKSDEKYEKLSNEVVKISESVKSAHNRIDELKQHGNKNE
jgi:hypothetical protein